MMEFAGFFREDEAIKWAQSRIAGDVGPHGLCRAMSVIDGDEIAAAVVFSGFTPKNIDLNFALDRHLPPKVAMETWRFAMRYAFGFPRVNRVSALVKSTNAPSKAFCEKLGFTQEGVLREAFDDDDLYVYGMLRKEYEAHRWNKEPQWTASN